MTVQVQNSYQYYNGPYAIGTVLSITDFTFIDNSYVSLKIRGIDEVWEYGTDYTIAGADTTVRTITLNRAVEAGQVLAAYLEVPITQNVSPEEGGNFPASTQEFTLDKLTYICQMLYERVIRSLQGSVDIEFNGILETPHENIGKAIIINSTGEGVAYSSYKIDDLEDIVRRIFASIDNIDIVAGISNDVTTVAGISSDVTTVASDISNIDSVLENLDIIDHAVENITTIHFDSVADMKASTTIKVNDIILTTGYYSANDGGGAEYKARTKTIDDVEDNGSIIFLQNNLVAELIRKTVVYVKQFGAKGDNTADDTVAIQKAIDFAKTFDEIVFDGLFKITDEIVISKPLIVRGKQGGVHGNSTYQKRTQGIQQYTANKNIFTLYPSTVADVNGKYDWSFYPTTQYGLGNCVFKDLYLCGSGKDATGGTAIALTPNTEQARWHFIHNLFDNIVIEKCNIGIDMTTWTVWNDNWNRVMIQQCYSAGIRFGRNDGDVGAGKLYFTDCWFYSSEIGIDCVTFKTRQINTSRCNFAYCTYGIKAHNVMDYFDYQSDFEDCTYGIYIENRNAISYTEFVLNQTIIGTNADIAASSYCIYLEPNHDGNTTTRFTIILEHCKLSRAALSLQDCCYLRLIGPAVNNFTNINAPYASIEKMFHIMPNRKICMWNTMRCAMTNGTGDTEQLFHVVELAAGKTIEIVTQIGGGLRSGTRVNCTTTIKNISTNTNIVVYNRQSQEWNESEAKFNLVAQTYKNNTNDKEYITFTAKGNNASDEYWTAVYYAIV